VRLALQEILAPLAPEVQQVRQETLAPLAQQVQQVRQATLALLAPEVQQVRQATLALLALLAPEVQQVRQETLAPLAQQVQQALQEILAPQVRRGRPARREAAHICAIEMSKSLVSTQERSRLGLGGSETSMWSMPTQPALVV